MIVRICEWRANSKLPAHIMQAGVEAQPVANIVIAVDEEGSSTEPSATNFTLAVE